MKTAHRLALADAPEGARDPRRRARARGGGLIDARAGVIDLFAGIGCVADGFGQTGRFEPLALIDQDPDAQAAYLHNRPGAPYRLGDVAALTAGDFDEIRAGRTIAGVLGCPPARASPQPDGGGLTISAIACSRRSSRRWRWRTHCSS
jgi:C-5 cytosine-specific DNA methylase